MVLTFTIDSNVKPLRRRAFSCVSCFDGIHSLFGLPRVLRAYMCTSGFDSGEILGFGLQRALRASCSRASGFGSCFRISHALWLAPIASALTGAHQQPCQVQALQQGKGPVHWSSMPGRRGIPRQSDHYYAFLRYLYLICIITSLIPFIAVIMSL